MLQITVFICNFQLYWICNCLWIFCTCFFQGADYGSTDHGIWCGLCQSDRNYVLLFIMLTCEKLLQSTGKTVYSMATQLLGAIINIILDPIMIFGLFGFPRMEVTGAALATVTGQIIAAIAGVIVNMKLNKELHISLVKYKISGDVIRSIYSVGFPSIIMASVGSVMTFGMNKILMGFTSTATAVFGVYFKLQSFIFMPVFGLNNGMVPIVAYNYGARKTENVLRKAN